MCGQVAVSLLVSSVFGYKVKVFSSNDQGSVHFGRDDGASQDSTANRDHTGEWAFLV